MASAGPPTVCRNPWRQASTRAEAEQAAQEAERRLLLEGGLEVEVGVTEPAWAATEPVDSGTRRVVADGLQILHDPEGRLGALVMVVAGDKP